MSVNDPVVCYKCHADVFAKLSMPSHHPVKEGKMFCGDCHDAHGQMEGNLKAESLNLLCWKCHAEKQGPFAYEHPPVTENCAYCHSPHGTVANNLLQQPTTFLCLRCHVGHRRRHHDDGPDTRQPRHDTSNPASLTTRIARRATPRSMVVTCRRHTSPACSGNVAADRTFNREIRMQILGGNKE